MFKQSPRGAAAQMLPFFFTTNVRASRRTAILNTKSVVSPHNVQRFYYANGFLDSGSVDFRRGTASINRSIQFTPNHELGKIGLCQHDFVRGVSSKVGLTSPSDTQPVEKNKDFSDAIIGKVQNICHPKNEDLSSTSHIPFAVKDKIKQQAATTSALTSFKNGEITFKKLTEPYLVLTKPNLTFLIMLSCISSYALSPNSVSVHEFMTLAAGVMLASGAANAINMGREPSFDKLMVRTAARPVVRGQVTSREAFTFAGITGSLGCTMLYFGVNPVVSGLAFANIVLYSWFYTSLKRKSILNTWLGALVGAIPPLMGWAASSSLMDPGAWCLAGILYAWQFPHFNSLSHNIKDEYKKAGYVMTAFENPKLNARVALRYSLLLFPLCYGLYLSGVTDGWFVLDSSLVNGWLTYMSFKFWNQQRINFKNGGQPTPEGAILANVYAKKMFWGSVWQLPGVLVLAMLHKRGMWDRFLSSDPEKEKLSSPKPNIRLKA
ncbi:unnamed protein product [Kuraishia capsulata CBS 1993]|uniref:Protoheme IX farnesyltransferase, mitochondrial n=1 Tax=Kuraishia capsulata CBS 1993 TaxID=1382522 RepID=W6MWV3_9ASCO|nr:uncharacterized protein KUCA_T00003895001 [Kuraishia capsulata CBS 1993]CDK27915.1 unnamed protein product [Kuraishia capsulata CBS 1993]